MRLDTYINGQDEIAHEICMNVCRFLCANYDEVIPPGIYPVPYCKHRKKYMERSAEPLSCRKFVFNGNSVHYPCMTCAHDDYHECDENEDFCSLDVYVITDEDGNCTLMDYSSGHCKGYAPSSRVDADILAYMHNLYAKCSRKITR